MDKGVSIFYEFHEQGSPHRIAGIYYPSFKSEEDMRKELLLLINSTGFHERDEPTYVNHTHVYANHLLGNELPQELKYLFGKFFPAGLKPDSLPQSPSKFYHYDSGADKFIWFNRYDAELTEHLSKLLKESSDAYKLKRQNEKKQNESMD